LNLNYIRFPNLILIPNSKMRYPPDLPKFPPINLLGGQDIEKSGKPPETSEKFKPTPSNQTPTQLRITLLLHISISTHKNPMKSSPKTINPSLTQDLIPTHITPSQPTPKNPTLSPPPPPPPPPPPS
jgi:hypothetical protein